MRLAAQALFVVLAGAGCRTVEPASPANATVPTGSSAPDARAAPKKTRPFFMEEARLALELPQAWRLTRRDGDGTGILYGFEREPVHGPGGHVARPFIGVVIEPVSPDEQRDVILFSAARRAQAPFEVTRVFIHSDGIMGLRNAMGYQGRVKYEGNTHEVYVVHALFRDKGISVIMDSTAEVFEQVEGEFLSTLASLRHVEKP